MLPLKLFGSIRVFGASDCGAILFNLLLARDKQGKSDRDKGAPGAG